MWEYRNTDELYHYGILGMRWGVRRYQNYDGSLTPAGRERYGYEYAESFRNLNKYRNRLNQKGSISKREQNKLEKLKNTNSEIKKKMDEYDRSHSVWNDQKIVDVEKASSIAKQLLPHDEKYSLTQRAKAAAVTGMESMKKTGMGDTHYLSTVDVNDPFEQHWFLNEDQTIGYAEIADLANKGYSASKIKSLLKDSYVIGQQMSDLYDAAESNNPHEDYYDTAPFDYSINDLAEAAESIGGRYEKELYNYIDACVDYNKKVKHSAIQPWHYVTTDELYHYGILGMKWGVRRYQNPDGSLTALGRLRYGTSENFNRVLAAKKKAADYKKNKKAYERQARKNKAADEEIKRIKREAGMKVKEDKPKTESTSVPKKEKKISEMTNKEIQEKINRIQLEKQLRREMASLQVEKVSKGKAFVNKIVKMANNPILRTALINPVAQHVGNQISAELKKSITPSKSDKLKKQAEDLKNEAFISNYRKQILENNKAINDHKKDPAYSAVFASLDKESQKDVKKQEKSIKKQEKKDNTARAEQDAKEKIGIVPKQEKEREVQSVDKGDTSGNSSNDDEEKKKKK